MTARALAILILLSMVGGLLTGLAFPRDADTQSTAVAAGKWKHRLGYSEYKAFTNLNH